MKLDEAPVRANLLSDADRQLVDGVLAGQRRSLAKAITLIESTRADHQQRAQQVLTTLLPQTGNAIRVGISGVPGAGKSTFIEALGVWMIEQGKKLAVLAINPSSLDLEIADPDDDLPELTEGLVSLLWPHYLRTIPSLSVVELVPELAQMKRSGKKSKTACWSGSRSLTP